MEKVTQILWDFTVKSLEYLMLKMKYKVERHTLPNLKPYYCQVPVAHACTPSYSGGRDQEN
jgi:hypothetical protein